MEKDRIKNIIRKTIKESQLLLERPCFSNEKARCRTRSTSCCNEAMGSTHKVSMGCKAADGAGVNEESCTSRCGSYGLSEGACGSKVVGTGTAIDDELETAHTGGGDCDKCQDNFGCRYWGGRCSNGCCVEDPNYPPVPLSELNESQLLNEEPGSCSSGYNRNKEGHSTPGSCDENRWECGGGNTCSWDSMWGKMTCGAMEDCNSRTPDNPIERIPNRRLHESQLLNEAPVQGAKVTAIICDPLPGEWTGQWVDDYFIRIYQQGTWVTPVVGMYMNSKAVGSTGAHKNYNTSWKIVSIQAYGTVQGDRQWYHKCTLDRPGCTDPTACNYIAWHHANVDDGSCIFPGCDDPTAANYVANLPAGCVCPDDFHGHPDCCEYIIPGCMDPTALNYFSLANTDDGSCEYPTTYACTDGHCDLDANGQYATLGECLVVCSLCAHQECYHCPGPTKIASVNDVKNVNIHEKIQSTPTTKACRVIGPNWYQALSDGISLYSTITECETAEAGCADKSVQTEKCHCCGGSNYGTSTAVDVEMVGDYGVGTCSSISIFGGTSVGGNSWTSTNLWNCAPIGQNINCSGSKEAPKGVLKKKEKDKEQKEDITEDVKRMKRIIKY